MKNVKELIKNIVVENDVKKAIIEYNGVEFKLYVEKLKDFHTSVYGTYYTAVLVLENEQYGIKKYAWIDKGTSGFEACLDDMEEEMIEDGVIDEDWNILDQEKYDEYVKAEDEMWFDAVAEDVYWWFEEDDFFINYVSNAADGYGYNNGDIVFEHAFDMDDVFTVKEVGCAFSYNEDWVEEILINGEHVKYVSCGEEVEKFINRRTIKNYEDSAWYIDEDNRLHDSYLFAGGNKVTKMKWLNETDIYIEYEDFDEAKKVAVAA